MEHWQIIINLIGGTALAAMGWFCRQVWDLGQELKNDLKRIEIDLPSHYMKKSEIEVKLDKIDARFDKLDAHITKLFERIEHKGLQCNYMTTGKRFFAEVGACVSSFLQESYLDLKLLCLCLLTIFLVICLLPYLLYLSVQPLLQDLWRKRASNGQ